MGKKSRRPTRNNSQEPLVEPVSAMHLGSRGGPATALGRQLCRSLLKEDVIEPEFMLCLSRADTSLCDDEESVFRAVLARAQHERRQDAVFSPRLLTLVTAFQAERLDLVYEEHRRELDQDEDEDLPPAFAEEGSNPTLLAELTAANALAMARSTDWVHVQRVLTPLLPRLEVPLTPDVQAATLELLELLAATSCVNAYDMLTSNGIDLDERPAMCLNLEGRAALLAFFSGGWRRSPCALWVRGASAHFRGNMAEAIADLSAAARMAAGWQEGAENPFRSLAHTMLRSARDAHDAKPCMGLWTKVQSASQPTPRLAAASCVVDGTMYVFGGIAPDRDGSPACGGYLACLRTVLLGSQEGPSHNPKSDLWALHIGSGTWRCLSAALQSSPPERGYAVLSHFDGKLYLFGGRTKYQTSSEILADMWIFDLTAGKWQAVQGRHPTVAEPSGGGVHERYWIIHDPGRGHAGVGRQLLRFDLKRHRWVPSVAGENMPVLDSPACCWMWNGSLWLWGPQLNGERGFVIALVEAKLGAAAETAVWCLHRIGLQSPEEHSSGVEAERSFTGPACFCFNEGAATVDETTGIAYVFGGWSDLFNTIMTSKTGDLQMHKGRYSNALIEVDVVTKTIRAVEPVMGAADTRARLGPKRRGHACVAACAGKVVVGFGYTTFDERTGAKTMQPMRDTWTCQILEHEVAKSFVPLPVDQQASGDIRPNEVLTFTAKFEDYDVYHKHARGHVLRDIELRKKLSNLCPSDNAKRGALLTVLVDSTGKALPPEKVYSPPLCLWVTEEDIHRLLPGMDHADPKLAASLRDQVNLEEHVLVIYLVYWGKKFFFERNLPGLLNPLLQAADVPRTFYVPATAPADDDPLTLYCDYFSRWKPNAIFFNLNPQGGSSIFSSQAELPTLPELRPTTRRPACAYEACPNLSDLQQQKLLKCSLCGLVRYCSRACQRADWPQHKLICRAVSGASSKG